MIPVLITAIGVSCIFVAGVLSYIRLYRRSTIKVPAVAPAERTHRHDK